MTKRFFLVAALACFLSASVAWGALIVSVQPLSTPAAPGSTGNSFDVLLSNTGPTSVTIGGFSFGITTTDTDVTFTDATTGTSVLTPYIFDGNSLFGPDIATNSGAQEVVASDYDADPVGATLGAGAVVGLGHVLYDVAPNATLGAFDLTLEAYPTTSFSDPNGNTVTPDTFTNGVGLIAPATSGVPEPGSGFLMLAGFLVAGLVARLRVRARTL